MHILGASFVERTEQTRVQAEEESTVKPAIPSDIVEHSEALEGGEKRRAERASAAWKDIVGFKISPERIQGRLDSLIMWRNKKPVTIRYMDTAQLDSLRTEIMEALLNQGTTEECASALVRSIPSVGDRLYLTPSVITVARSQEHDMENSTERLPYISDRGELIIPFNCPEKYRWWQGGQSIEKTRAELMRAHDE